MTKMTPPNARTPLHHYFVDGLNVCQRDVPPSLSLLLILLLELLKRNATFLCVFDANTRFALGPADREQYTLLLTEHRDAFAEVTGGVRADDVLLLRAHNTGCSIVTNDRFRKYFHDYPWLRKGTRLIKLNVVGSNLVVHTLKIDVPITSDVAALFQQLVAALQARSPVDSVVISQADAQPQFTMSVGTLSPSIPIQTLPTLAWLRSCSHTLGDPPPSGSSHRALQFGIRVYDEVVELSEWFREPLAESRQIIIHGPPYIVINDAPEAVYCLYIPEENDSLDDWPRESLCFARDDASDRILKVGFGVAASVSYAELRDDRSFNIAIIGRISGNGARILGDVKPRLRCSKQKTGQWKVSSTRFYVQPVESFLLGGKMDLHTITDGPITCVVLPDEPDEPDEIGASNNRV